MKPYMIKDDYRKVGIKAAKKYLKEIRDKKDFKYLIIDLVLVAIASFITGIAISMMLFN